MFLADPNRSSRYHLLWPLAWIAAVMLFAPAAGAQAPYAQFQFGTFAGSGNTITATNVPVVTASGATVYMNLVAQFDVDGAGNLSLTAGFPQVTPSQAPMLTSSILAGRYVGPSNVNSGKNVIMITGPAVSAGGQNVWTIAAPTDATGCTYPSSASFYVGPLDGHPLAARLKNAGITSTAWSYGLGSSTCYTEWPSNGLIGVSQVGNTLTIASFTFGTTDKSMPIEQITYTAKAQ